MLRRDGDTAIDAFDQHLLVEPVDAAVERDVAPLAEDEARQTPLAEFVQKIELREDAVVVKAAPHFLLDVAHPGGRGETAKPLAMKSGKKAEAAFDPPFEHRALVRIGVVAPAAQ